MGVIFISKELDYIKETGMEIAKLNQIINEKDEKIIMLTEEIGRLKAREEKHEQTIENLSQLYNEIYYKQSDLRKERNRYEKRFIAISETLMCILPELAEKVNEDLNEHELFSKILRTIEDKEMRWW